MIEVKVRLSSRQRVYVPDIEAFDRDSGEPVDPVLAGLDVLFALVPQGAPDPADSEYVGGSWVPNKPTPTAMVMVGAGSALVPASRGNYDLWMGVNGVSERPRDVVATVVVP